MERLNLSNGIGKECCGHFNNNRSNSHNAARSGSCKRLVASFHALLFALVGTVLADDTDLGITVKSISDTPAVTSSTFTIALQPKNFGPGTSGSTEVTLDIDSSPGAETISSASGTGYTCYATPSTTITCTRAGGITQSTEASPANTVMFVVTTQGTTGDVDLAYSISHDDVDSVGGNDSGSVTVAIESASSLGLCYASSDGNDDLVTYNKDGSGSPGTVGDMGRANIERHQFRA